MISSLFLKRTATFVLGALLFGAPLSWPQAPASSDWKIAGPFGGTALSIAIDPTNPQTLLAGGLNTLLYRTENAGQSWTLLDFPTRHLGEVGAVLIDPSDANHYFAGVLDAFGGALFESKDRGVTWNPVPSMSTFAVRALTISKSDPKEFVAGTTQGVFLSKDSGATWNRISDLNNLEMRGITSVAIDPANPDVIYAGTSHLPWKTSDAGKSWHSIHDGMIDDSDVFSIYVNPQAPSDVYASACSGIYASKNGGESWKKIAGIPNTSRRTHVIRLDPAHPETIYAGTTSGLYESPNGGTTWRTVSNTQVNSIAFDPAQPQVMYLAMLNAGIGKSQDSGQVIQPINEGFTDRFINWVTESGKNLVAIEGQEGDTTGIFTSSDAGRTWSQKRDSKALAGVHLRYIAGSLKNEKVLLAANANTVFRSEDSGSLWRPLALKIVSEEKISVPLRRKGKNGRYVTTHVDRIKKSVKPLTFGSVAGLWTMQLPDKDAILLATDNGLYQSTDNGDGWSRVELPAASRPDAVYIGRSVASPIFVKTSDALLVSRDSAQKWDALTLPQPVADVNEVAASDDGNHILIATRTGLIGSSDGGKTWAVPATGLPKSTVTSVVFGSDNVAYATEYGQLFRSDDAGSTWQLAPTKLGHVSINRLWCPEGKRLYALAAGVGVLYRE